MSQAVKTPEALRANRADEGSASSAPLLVLRKVTRILDAFTPAAAELSLPELRDLTELPTSTCARLVQNLVADGFLQRNGDKYRIGVAVLRWSAAALHGLDLVSLVQPVLVDLRDSTGESAALFVRQGASRTCVAVVPTRHAVIWQLYVGMTTPLYVGSGGRAILAFDADAERLVLRQERTAFTDFTITDRDRLAAVLADVRAHGYAVSSEELDIGVGGVSAPVFDLAGRVVAAIGVAGPAQRFGPQQVQLHVPAVLGAARAASEALGGTFDTQVAVAR